MRNVTTGPVIVSGNLKPDQLQDTDVGPSLIFQGQGLLDPRQVQTIDAAAQQDPVPGFYNSEMVSLLDQLLLPSAAANIYTIAAATVVPSGGATTPAQIVLASSSPAIAPNVPLVPFGFPKIPLANGPASPVVTVPVTLDFGFMYEPTGGTNHNFSTTAGSNVLTLSTLIDSRFFFKGQWLCVPGAGTTAVTPWVGQVTGGIGTTAITLSTNAGQTIAAGSCGVGTLDFNGAGAWPWIKTGATAMFDPTQSVARALRVVSNNAADTGYSVTVRGWDIYGVPMTENIPVTANATAYGKKAWKYINSWSLLKTGGGTLTGTVTIGTSDVYGMPLRSDYFEYMSMYYNAAFIATNGPTTATNPWWTASDTTSPALATSGDVRGTVQIGAAGPQADTATSPTGHIRFAAFMSVPAYNAVNANNLNFATLLGALQNQS